MLNALPGVVIWRGQFGIRLLALLPLNHLGGPAFSTPFGVAAREPGRHLALLRALHLSLSGSRRSGRASRPSLHSLKLSRGLSPLRVAFCAPFGVLPFARPSGCCLLRALRGVAFCAPCILVVWGVAFLGGPSGPPCVPVS